MTVIEELLLVWLGAWFALLGTILVLGVVAGIISLILWMKMTPAERASWNSIDWRVEAWRRQRRVEENIRHYMSRPRRPR